MYASYFNSSPPSIIAQRRVASNHYGDSSEIYKASISPHESFTVYKSNTVEISGLVENIRANHYIKYHFSEPLYLRPVGSRR